MTMIDQQASVACISHTAVQRLDTDGDGQVTPQELTTGLKQDTVTIGFGGAVIAKGFPVTFAPCLAPSTAVTAMRQRARATLGETAVLTGAVTDENGSTIFPVDVTNRQAGSKVKTLTRDGALIPLSQAPKDAFGFVANDGELANLDQATLVRLRASAEAGSRIAHVIDTALDLMALQGADPEVPGREMERHRISERALRAVSMAPDADFHPVQAE